MARFAETTDALWKEESFDSTSGDCFNTVTAQFREHGACCSSRAVFFLFSRCGLSLSLSSCCFVQSWPNGLMSRSLSSLSQSLMGPFRHDLGRLCSDDGKDVAAVEINDEVR